MDKTAKAFVAHWSWAAEKGLMNKSTAHSWRAACTQVLSVLENWESIDVTTINPDDVFHRFKNLRAKNFTPGSLKTYESRFKSALESYLLYIKDPGAWKPKIQSRSSRTTEQEAVSKKDSQPSVLGQRSIPDQSEREALVDYPFPLRDGLTVRLMLPRNITKTEVKRLQAFMSVLAVDAPANE